MKKQTSAQIYERWYAKGREHEAGLTALRQIEKEYERLRKAYLKRRTEEEAGAKKS